jgi:hypothetical protein
VSFKNNWLVWFGIHSFTSLYLLFVLLGKNASGVIRGGRKAEKKCAKEEEQEKSDEKYFI